MKLNEYSFNEVKNGNKKREYRLYDDKRKQVRIGDTIKFLKLPNLDEEVIVDVKDIEVFDTWYDCYSKYFEQDFKDRYKDVDEVVQDTFSGGYYTEEESSEYKCVVFTIKKHRLEFYDAAACYLRQGDKVLMLKYKTKWNHVYTPPGGKFEKGESPVECATREFYEETGLKLINPKLQGISYWYDKTEGVIFIYTADEYEGELRESEEGTLEWVDIESLENLEQFDQNRLFTPYLFKDKIFEGKFKIDSNSKVSEYELKTY